MQSFDDRPRSMFSPVTTQEPGQVAPSTGQLMQEGSLTPPQVAFDQTNILSLSPSDSPVVTDPLTPLPSSNATRVLTGTLTESGEAAVQRAPVIIRGNLKKPVASSSQVPHTTRRRIVSMTGIVVLFLVLSVSLLTATPLGHTIGLGLNPSQSNNPMQMVNNGNGNNTLNSVVAQATATAVFTKQQPDGYDPYANGGVTVAPGNSPRPWPYGQCTYWANLYYHQLSGWWVNWSGNAYQWYGGAQAAGWNVSTVPHVPSIAILMPGVQGASNAYGHVAVVTSIINGTTVMTSNMNWYAFGGGLGIVSNVEFYYGPGSGVYFAWHP